MSKISSFRRKNLVYQSDPKQLHEGPNLLFTTESGRKFLAIVENGKIADYSVVDFRGVYHEVRVIKETRELFEEEEKRREEQRKKSEECLELAVLREMTDEQWDKWNECLEEFQGMLPHMEYEKRCYTLLEGEWESTLEYWFLEVSCSEKW